MDHCSCQKWTFEEALLEDTEQPIEFYHISAVGYVYRQKEINADKDK